LVENCEFLTLPMHCVQQTAPISLVWEIGVPGLLSSLIA